MDATRFFAVIPAAGRSQRMGRPKLLLPWRGKTVWEHVLAAWTGTDRPLSVVAVVHPDDAEVARLARQAGVEAVVPQVPPAEMKLSVRLGLERLKQVHRPAPTDAWLLAPADMPRLRPGIIDAVMTAYMPGRPMILLPEHQGKRGHPVLFPWSLAEEVDRLGPDEGLNRLVDRHEQARLPMLDSAVLADLDTPEDYERLQANP